jgi:hypothetical protein
MGPQSEQYGQLDVRWDTLQQRSARQQHRLRDRFRPSIFRHGNQRQFVQRMSNYMNLRYLIG